MQVLMVRFSSLFDVKQRTVSFLSGRSYSVEALRSMGAGELLSSMFDFSEKLVALQLSPEETSLFTALVLVSAGTKFRTLKKKKLYLVVDLTFKCLPTFLNTKKTYTVVLKKNK